MGSLDGVPGTDVGYEWSTAGIRDCWLGGTRHTATDREVADHILVGTPQLPYVVRTYRALLRRVVTYLVQAGVRQFLDLGSGIPAAGNVHEVAQDLAPDSRVVYVDMDDDVVRDARALLADREHVAAVQQDLRHPDRVLAAVAEQDVLDLTEPLALLVIDVLHLVPDTDDPQRFFGAYIAALPCGSYVCLTQADADDALVKGLEMFHNFYKMPVPPLTFRGREQLGHFLDGLELVEPGIVPVPLWHPGDGEERGADPDHFPGHAVLARKP